MTGSGVAVVGGVMGAAGVMVVDGATVWDVSLVAGAADVEVAVVVADDGVLSEAALLLVARVFKLRAAGAGVFTRGVTSSTGAAAEGALEA